MLKLIYIFGPVLLVTDVAIAAAARKTYTTESLNFILI